MVTKTQLRDELYALNIPVYGGHKIKKVDIQKVIASLEGKTNDEHIITASVPLDFVKKVIDAIKKKLKTKEPPDFEKLNSFIKKNTPGDLMAFARDAISYFKQGKLKWDDELALLQDEYQPGGFEVIPWSFLKRQLSDLKPEIEQTLPRAFVQKLET